MVRLLISEYFNNSKIILLIFLNIITKIRTIISFTSDKVINIEIKDTRKGKTTSVDRYWSNHTIGAFVWNSQMASRIYYSFLINRYPLLENLMEYKIDLTKKIVLDYGCGVGNDLFRFIIKNNAKKVIGIDISPNALYLAQSRLKVHDIKKNKVEILLCNDSANSISLENESIDYIYCAGVLMHTTNPKKILREFYRVLKRGKSGIIMVYNYESIWLHFYVAYLLMIKKQKYKLLTIEEAFSKTTDGEHCPIARCYKPEVFTSLCKDVGFNVEYKGGYFSIDILRKFKQNKKNAICDEKLDNEHKYFLKKLTYDQNGYPLYNGFYAGVHGVYKIYKS